MAKVLVIMGVSGSGKSTIGRLLAQKINGTFLDGDDFHPPENIAKMASGQALNDADRQGWLAEIAQLVKTAQLASDPTIIACSALKKIYRDHLKSVEFVFLSGSRALIEQRIQARESHFMPPSLLDSQFADLEVPADTLTLDIARSPEELVQEIRAQLFAS